MKFNATTIVPEDAQFLMTRTFQVEEIARLYGIPLHMLQSQAKSTSWGSGIAQMSLGFLIYTIAPWLVRWEQASRQRPSFRRKNSIQHLPHNTKCIQHQLPRSGCHDPESNGNNLDRSGGLANSAFCPALKTFRAVFRQNVGGHDK